MLTLSDPHFFPAGALMKSKAASCLLLSLWLLGTVQEPVFSKWAWKKGSRKRDWRKRARGNFKEERRQGEWREGREEKGKEVKERKRKKGREAIDSQEGFIQVCGSKYCLWLPATLVYLALRQLSLQTGMFQKYLLIYTAKGSKNYIELEDLRKMEFPYTHMPLLAGNLSFLSKQHLHALP